MAKESRFLFEDTGVGRMKKRIFEMSDAEVEEAAKVLGVPSPGELEKPGTYIQTTVRKELVENRRKNDIVIIPVGCTENHGLHTASGFDTFLVTRLAEAVRRKQIQDGKPPVNIAWPVNYGVHPPWHQGMYGSVMLSDDAFEQSIMMMAWGLWNDGYRKQIWINNHAQNNELEKAIKRFMNTMQLPGFFMACEWHRAVREFFETKEFGGKLEDRFIHADEAETSLGLELFPEFVNMDNCEQGDTLEGFKYLPDGHFDKSVEDLIRPNTYKTAGGHAPLEVVAQPEAVVGKPGLAEAGKTLRAVVAFCEYLDLLCDDVLNTWPVGTVPDPESITFRTNKEMEPYLKEPGSEGWKSAYALPKIGPYTY